MSIRVHKGFLPKVGDCIEYSSLTLSALRDAKRVGTGICVSWIDFKNAFRSVRHPLLQFALNHFSLPYKFKCIIYNYLWLGLSPSLTCLHQYIIALGLHNITNLV